MALQAHTHPDKGWKIQQRIYYREIAARWVERVRARGVQLDQAVDAVADALLKLCLFLHDV
jgi:hypothetical protein